MDTPTTRKARQRARDRQAGMVELGPIRAPLDLAAWIANEADGRACTRRQIIIEALESARANTEATTMNIN